MHAGRHCHITRILAFILFCSCLNAQRETVVFDLFDEDDGLPTNNVLGVYQDRQGILWFTSQEGLIRYDGYGLTTYSKRIGDSNALRGNYISALYDDAQDRLWVGTGNAGLHVSDREKTQFFILRNRDGSRLIQSRAIASITKDSKHNYWIAGDRGVEVVRESDGAFEKIGIPGLAAGSPAERLLSQPNVLCADGHGRVWVGSEFGIACLNAQQNEWRLPGNTTGLLPYPVDDIGTDRTGALWASFKKDGARIYRFDEMKLEFKALDALTFDDTSGALGFTFDFDNRLWAAVFGDQLYGFDFRDSSVFLVSSRNSNIRRERFLRKPFCDLSGKVWIPGAGHHTLSYPQGFRHYYHPFGFHQYNSTIYADSLRMLMAYRESGLVEVDLRTGEARHLSTAVQSTPQLATDHIQDIALISPGVYALAGFGNLMFLDLNNQSVKTYKSTGTSRDIFVDSKQRIWLGDFMGLARYRLDSGLDTIYQLPPLLNDPRNFIQTVVEDMYGHIWFGSGFKGLAKLDNHTGEITQFLPPDGFPSLTLVDMVIGADGNIWAGTDVGLVRFDIHSLTYEVFDKRHGLANNYIASVILTKSGDIWVSTHSGIASFDPDEQSFRTFSVDQGLLNRVYYDRNKFYDSEGRLYFGGKKGVDFFHPDDLRANHLRPVLHLAGITVDGEKMPTGKAESNHLEFTHRHKIFEFELSGLFYDNPAGLEYEYMLEGLHQDWINIGTRRIVAFNNLDWRDYTFRARAISPHGQNSQNEVEVSFSVIPPVWGTWWFRGAGLVMLAVLVFSVAKWREIRIRKKERKEASFQQRIIELEKKALLAQMNPHFIFNSMNSIQQFMAVGDFEGAMKYLTKFARLLRFVLNVSSESLITLSDELALIEDYLILEQMRFPDKFSYEINIDESVDIHNIEIAPFFIQPQVENSIRHGLLHKNGSGHIEISIYREPEGLRIIVQDNGIGRRASAELQMQRDPRDTRMGLALVEERLKHLHENYNEHTMTIEDLYDDEDDSDGTRVTILLPLEQ